MSHLTNIGFNVSSAEEFEALVAEVFEKGTEIDVENGIYILYRDKSGAEIYAQVDNDNEFMGFIPAFNAEYKRSVEITSEIEYEDATALDMRCMVEATEDSAPFIFDVPNGKEYKFDFPYKTEVALVGFPHEVEYFSTSEEFMKAYPTLSTTYFIPVGMINQEGEPMDTPEAYAMFIGKIKSVELRVNALKGGEFYVIVLETLDGDITTVMAKGFLEKEPKVDAFINGVFWMTAKL
jgi:hypothetical protein